MAMLIVVVERDGDVSLDASTAQKLADIGVTSIAVAADETTEAIVLEGWAFDPTATGAEAAAVLVGSKPHRSLVPALQTLLPPATQPAIG